LTPPATNQTPTPTRDRSKRAGQPSPHSSASPKPGHRNTTGPLRAPRSRQRSVQAHPITCCTKYPTPPDIAGRPLPARADHAEPVPGSHPAALPRSQPRTVRNGSPSERRHWEQQSVPSPSRSAKPSAPAGGPSGWRWPRSQRRTQSSWLDGSAADRPLQGFTQPSGSGRHRATCPPSEGGEPAGPGARCESPRSPPHEPSALPGRPRSPGRATSPSGDRVVIARDLDPPAGISGQPPNTPIQRAAQPVRAMHPGSNVVPPSPLGISPDIGDSPNPQGSGSFRRWCRAHPRGGGLPVGHNMTAGVAFWLRMQQGCRSTETLTWGVGARNRFGARTSDVARRTCRRAPAAFHECGPPIEEHRRSDQHRTQHHGHQR